MMQAAFRTKIGDVYQLHTKEVILVCSHCTNEFEYFSEFSLHAQEHLQQLWQQSFTVLRDIDKNDSPQTQDVPTKSTIDEGPFAKTVLNCGNVADWMKTENSSDGSVLDDCRNDDDISSCQGDSIQVNETSWQLDDPVSIVKTETFPETSLDDPIPIDDIQINIASTSKNAESTSKSHRKPKKSPKRKYNKITGDHSVQYKRCIKKYQASTSKADALRKLNIFRMSIKVFPCHVEDTAESRMLANYLIKTAKYPLTADGQQKCPVCSIAYKNVYLLKKHILAHAKKPLFRCELCTKRCHSAQQLQKHFDTDHSTAKFEFECFLCHSEFPNFQALQQHIKAMHTRENYCTYCDKSFTRHEQYQNHFKNRHPQGFEFKVGMRVSTVQCKPHISMFECFLCHKDFRKRHQLRLHTRLHNRRPRLCLICGAQYRSKAYFYNHMKLHAADGAKAHNCDICGKSFAIRTYMLRHRRIQHKIYVDEKQSSCEVCGVTFERRTDLFEHMKSHPVEEQRQHICSLCNYPAPNPSALKQHMEVHSTERPFECPVCHKRYRQSSALEHMRTHNEDRPFVCKVCGKGFKRKPTLTKHSYSHGGPNVPAHACDLCDKIFTLPDQLLKHRRTHNVAMNYHCSFCNKGFIAMRSLQLHEASHIKQRKDG